MLPLLPRPGLLAFSFFVPCLLFAQSGSAQLSSPDGRITIRFDIRDDHDNAAGAGQLFYSLSFAGKSVIDESRLALNLQGARPLGAAVSLIRAISSQADDTYTLVTGKTSRVRDRYNSTQIELAEPAGLGRRLTIEARAFNDAVAFRYLVPQQNTLRDFRLESEATEFHLSKDAVTYALVLPHYRTMYESEYLKVNASSFASKNGLSRANLVGLPMLLQLPGVAWMAITEANIHNYSSMYLVNQSDDWGGRTFTARLAPGDDPAIAVNGALPHHSSWRVLIIGDEPGRLVESNVITSLNPPSEIKDPSWIHAGLTAWDWWSGSLDPRGKHAFTTDNMKHYVDFAAASGFTYMLVDAGWSKPHDITQMNGTVDIPELVKYATPKNVKIWIWLLYSEADAQMEEAFPLYEKWGVAGLKIDFVERDDQRGIDFYYRAAAKAAEHRLMLDFHGATKPSGVERTWPNILGYEAVLGMEQSKVGMRDNPDHRLTLPFTRMLAGPMDYTPGGFENVTLSEFAPRGQHPMVMGTRAQQLAMYAVYQAAFQMVSDAPQAYKDQPAFEFIRHVPASWDETHVIAGLPSEFITIARRHGDEWFLGSMTNWTPRQMSVSLDFLGQGRYTAEIYADADDADRYPKNVRVYKQSVDRNAKLNLNLAPGGGCAVRFVPIH